MIWLALGCGLLAGMTAMPVALALQEGDGASRENQISIGEVGNVGEYELTVLEVTPDATDPVLAQNQFNDPPADGNQFFIARVAVTYIGAENGTPWLDLNFGAVGDSNVGYAIFNNSCGVIPDDFIGTNDLFEGGSAEFNICWQIATGDAASLTMYVDEVIDFDGDPVWFSLGGDSSMSSSTPFDGLKTVGEDAEVVAASSRDNPIPVGSTGRVGDFEITVTEIVPFADEFILTENEFNEQPAAGNQFFMANLTITNVGTEVTLPWLDLSFQAVGDSSTGYNEFDNTCGVIPDSSLNSGDVFPGGTVSFNVCWQIKSADADSLVMYVDPLISFDESDRSWFSLDS